MRQVLLVLSICGCAVLAGLALASVAPSHRAWPAPLRVLRVGDGTGGARWGGAFGPSWEQDAFRPWRESGFAVLEPPIPLPGDEGGRLHTSIVVFIPEGESIDVDDDGWHWPVGARLDRIEWMIERGAPRIADVRATELGAEGERFLAYRPAGVGSDEPLVGAGYLRDDEVGRASLRMAFEELAGAGGVFLSGERGSDARFRSRSLARLAETHHCVSCHEHNQSEAAPSSDRWLRRATDASGFYVPAYVMQDHAPMERYRPVDRAMNQPFVSVRCGDRVVARDDRSTAFRCPGDGSIPVLTLDVASARAVHDEHVERVCASRRYLGERMTERARARYQGALAECGAP